MAALTSDGCYIFQSVFAAMYFANCKVNSQTHVWLLPTISILNQEKKVARISEMGTKRKMLWPFSKFSELIFQGTYDQFLQFVFGYFGLKSLAIHLLDCPLSVRYVLVSVRYIEVSRSLSRVSDLNTLLLIFQAMHFDRDDINLPGFHKFFKESAEEEMKHAQKVI